MGTIKRKLNKPRGRYNFVFGFGNAKLPKTTAVFNITSAKNCPSRKLGLCQAIDKQGRNRCYAWKAERFYPQSLPFKVKQNKFWNKTSAENFVIRLMESAKTNKFNVLRFNESGDFRNQDDISKADRIAGYLKILGISTYAYTARKDLDFSKVKFIKIMGSGFKKTGISGEFKFITDIKYKPDNYGICIGDCAVCNRCLQGKDTCVLMH